MKNQKGITLISLIIYIIAMLIAISLITVITTSMTEKLGSTEKASKSISKINKFDMYFLSDIKNEGVSIYDIVEDKNIILQDKNGNIIQYIFENNVIYRIEGSSGRQIQICNNVNEFEATENDERKDIVTIKITVEEYISQKDYKIGKW